MKKIYVVDYGIESDGEIKNCSSTYSADVKKLLEDEKWKKTDFDSTLWKEAGDECDVQQIERELRMLISAKIGKCKVSLLVLCVDKVDVYGTNKNGEACFGTKFIFPSIA